MREKFGPHLHDEDPDPQERQNVGPRPTDAKLNIVKLEKDSVDPLGTIPSDKSARAAEEWLANHNDKLDDIHDDL